MVNLSCVKLKMGHKLIGIAGKNPQLRMQIILAFHFPGLNNSTRPARRLMPDGSHILFLRLLLTESKPVVLLAHPSPTTIHRITLNGHAALSDIHIHYSGISAKNNANHISNHHHHHHCPTVCYPRCLSPPIPSPTPAGTRRH